MELRGKLVQTLVGIIEIGEMLLLSARDAARSVRQGRDPVAAVLFRQIYFAGFEAVRVTLATALLIGTVIVTQMLNLVGTGSLFLTGKIMVWLVFRELAPLLTATIVIARSGTAITAELSQMKISGEIDYIQTLGIPTSQYLVMPRIYGVASAMVLLSVYFASGAILGGALVASLLYTMPMEQYWQGIFSVLDPAEILLLFSKSLLFGLAIPVICCREGLKVDRSATQIPQAAKRGVLFSLITVFVLDGFITLFFIAAS
jgi:phospholipid/cholesterol/gamma-HCH transport system permease protein